MTAHRITVGIVEQSQGWYVTITVAGEGVRRVGRALPSLAAARVAAVAVAKDLASHLEGTLQAKTEVTSIQ